LVAFSALRDKAPNAPFPFLEDTMTTPRNRSLVSFAAVLTVALTLAGCASAPVRLASDEPAVTEELPVSIPFENAARNYVHVYLVGQKREWFLGRVEIGARATLRIPDEALAEDAGPMRLAVLEGQRMTGRVAIDPHATTMLTLPVEAIVSQKWTFSETASTGQLTWLPRRSYAR
jgi:hypothetical protein